MMNISRAMCLRYLQCRENVDCIPTATSNGIMIELCLPLWFGWEIDLSGGCESAVNGGYGYYGARTHAVEMPSMHASYEEAL